MKKTLALLLPLAGLALTSCGELKISSGRDVVVGETTIAAKTVKTLSYQAVTGLMAMPTPANVKGRKMSDEAKAKIAAMLPQIDAILSNGSGFEATVSESDNPEYKIKQEIAVNLGSKISESCTLYYNVVEEKNETEEEEGETEVSASTVFEGIAIRGEETFTLHGVSARETETEGQETETEEELKLRISSDVHNYVEIKQEIETENGATEQEFKYKVVADGKTTLSYSFETEDEDGKKESEFKLRLDGVKYKFETKDIDGKAVIEVKIEGSEESDGKARFVRTIVVNEDGTETVIYEEYKA